jgi:hypothetical protein
LHPELAAQQPRSIDAATGTGTTSVPTTPAAQPAPLPNQQT